MKFIYPLIIFTVITITAFAQNVSVLSWNIQDLGRTKDENEISQIVDILKDYDLVAIQEVVAKDPAGAQKVALIADELDRKGFNWDYAISVPTKSPSSNISERYAFLWKSSKIQLQGEAYLDAELEAVCNREPYIGKFKIKENGKELYLVNFHARTFNQQPEEEIKYLIDYPERLESNYIIIAGDFNLNDRADVWRKLYKKGFKPSLRMKPSTLKRNCDDWDSYFGHAIDNLYYNKDVFQYQDSGVIDFVGDCENLKTARSISDHLPVFLTISVE